MQKAESDSIVSFRDNSIVINEMVPSSLTSIEAKQEKGSNGKTGNNQVRFPLKFRRFESQPNSTPEGFKKFKNSYTGSEEDIISSDQIETKSVTSNISTIGESKLKDMIKNLRGNPVEEQIFEGDETSVSDHAKVIKRSRQFLVDLMEQPNFHYLIIVLIMIDLIIVFIELVLAQLSLPCLTEDEMIQYNATQQRLECLLLPSDATEKGELALYSISLMIISLFVIEILTATYAFGWRRYKKAIYLIDAIVVLASFILEIYFHFSDVGKVGRVAAGIVVLRLWKIIRAIHAIAHSMALRNHIIITHIEEAKKILNDQKIEAEKIIDKQRITIQGLIKLTIQKPKETNQSD